MSKDIIIKVRDDLDGSDADETIPFSYRGVDFEIDLSDTNVELFDKSIQQFIDAARKIVAERRRGADPFNVASVDAKAIAAQKKRIRVWARNNGYEVSSRGIIAATIIDAYFVAHPAEKLLTLPTNGAAPLGTLTAQELAKTGGRLTATRPKHRATSDLTKEQRDRIRDWANENDMEQSYTGYIRGDVYDAFYEAFPDERPKKSRKSKENNR